MVCLSKLNTLDKKSLVTKINTSSTKYGCSYLYFNIVIIISLEKQRASKTEQQLKI